MRDKLDAADADHDAKRDQMFDRPAKDEFHGWHPDVIIAERRQRIVLGFVARLHDADMLSYEHAELVGNAHGDSK